MSPTAPLNLRAGPVDLASREISRATGPVRLRPREAELLAWLAQHPEQLHSRDQLYQAVWGRPMSGRALDVTIRLLRQKIEVDPGRPDHLLTVHGQGYRFVPLATRARARPSRLLTEPPDLFVGRHQLVDQLAAALSQPGAAVLLRGPGGMGKTRLARRLARQRATQDPAIFVDLSSCHRAHEIHQVLAQCLDVPLGAGGTEEANTQRLGAVLADRHGAWLILDNLEQISQPITKMLEIWHGQAPGIRWLLTSRHSLALPWIQEIDLAPLDPQAGVSLMLDRARARFPLLELDPPERQAMARLSDWLDGIPLALEMAARKLAVMGATELHRRLQARSETLSSARHDLSERHRKLELTIGWSWDLLSPEARALLTRCAIFEGHFSRALISGVDPATTDEATIRAAVTELLDASMLTWHDGPDPTDHFRLYQVIRQWCRQRPEFTARASQLHAAHARLFLQQAETLTAQIPGSGAIAARQRLLAFLPDLLAARSWFTTADPTRAVRVLLTIDRALWRRGPHPLQREALDQAIDLATRITDPRLEARARIARADARGRRGGVAQAERDLARALELLPAPAHAVLRARALLVQSQNLERMGSLLAAETATRQALDLLDPGQQPGLEAALRTTRGHILTKLGRHEAATTELTRAQDNARRCADVELEAMVASTRALSASARGDLTAMKADLEQALALYQQADNQVSVGSILGNLGVLAFRQERRLEAIERFGQAGALSGRMGDLTGQAVACCNRGSVFFSLERLPEAEAEWHQALALAQRLQKPELEGATQLLLGVLAQLQRELPQAEQHLEQARAQLGPQSPYRCRALGHLGALQAQLGRREAALQLFAQARELPSGQPDGRWHGLLQILEGTLELEQATRSATAAERQASIRAVRQRIRAAERPDFSDEIDAAIRLLRMGLRDLARSPSAPHGEPER